ncbi:hypothetical protein D4R75_05920 [bacterium]|nr:MAG: hypothetical protein D4R75_05920 [bacterium]
MVHSVYFPTYDPCSRCHPAARKAHSHLSEEEKFAL